MNKNKKVVIIAVCVLVVLLAAALAVVHFTSADTTVGAKTVIFEVVSRDGTSKEYTLETDELYLGDALLEADLVTESEHSSGFYTSIAGQTALWSDNESWWCISKDGVDLTVGMNEQPIEDGEHYEATFTSGS